MKQAINTNTPEQEARQDGFNMAVLYRTNIGSLDAFYRLLTSFEAKYQGEHRKAFLDAFFDAVEIHNEGGTQ